MKNKSPDNTGEKQEIRGDIKTRFKKGESGNPKGRATRIRFNHNRN